MKAIKSSTRFNFPSMKSFTLPRRKPTGRTAVLKSKDAFFSKIQSAYHDRSLKKRDIILTILAGIGIVLAVAAMQVAWRETKLKVEFDWKVQIFQAICSGSTILLLFAIVEYYSHQANYMGKKYKLSTGVRFWHFKDLRIGFYLEMIVCSVHPVPGLSFISPHARNVEITYSILTILMFLRVYILVRTILHFYPFFSNRHSFNQRKNFSFNWQFILREVWESHSLLVTVWVWVAMISILTYGIYLAERNVQPLKFSTYQDSLWCIAITAATVGYGDSFPISNFGRAFAVGAGWLGIVVGAGMTAAIFKAFSLTLTEKIAVDTYRLDEVEQELQQSAAILVQTAFRRSRWRKMQSAKSATEAWAIEEGFQRKIGFLFYRMRSLRRKRQFLMAQLGEDSTQAAAYGKVKDINRRLEQLNKSLRLEEQESSSHIIKHAGGAEIPANVSDTKNESGSEDDD